MKAILIALTLLASISISGCSEPDNRPSVLNDWTDEQIEDEISAYREAIRTLEDEQRRRSLSYTL